MAYSRTTWVAEETPLSADNFNNIEDGIEELQAEKVDKVSGKGLSTNDYTTEEKTKLAGIAAGAEVNVQSDWNQSSTSADDFIKNKPGNATTSAAGLMSAADKTKLDGIAESADAIGRDYETIGGFSKTIPAQSISSHSRVNSRLAGKRLINLYAQILGADDAALNVMYTLDYFNVSTGQWDIKIFNPSSTSVTVKKINVTAIYT